MHLLPIVLVLMVIAQFAGDALNAYSEEHYNFLPIGFRTILAGSVLALTLGIGLFGAKMGAWDILFVTSAAFGIGWITLAGWLVRRSSPAVGVVGAMLVTTISFGLSFVALSAVQGRRDSTPDDTQAPRHA